MRDLYQQFPIRVLIILWENVVLVVLSILVPAVAVPGRTCEGLPNAFYTLGLIELLRELEASPFESSILEGRSGQFLGFHE